MCRLLTHSKLIFSIGCVLFADHVLLCGFSGRVLPGCCYHADLLSVLPHTTGTAGITQCVQFSPTLSPHTVVNSLWSLINTQCSCCAPTGFGCSSSLPDMSGVFLSVLGTS